MNLEEFQHLARLYAIGALEPDELREFQTVRAFLGPRAERYITDCRRLNDAIVSDLEPIPPSPTAREKVLRLATRDRIGG